MMKGVVTPAMFSISFCSRTGGLGVSLFAALQQKPLSKQVRRMHGPRSWAHDRIVLSFVLFQDLIYFWARLEDFTVSCSIR